MRQEINFRRTVMPMLMAMIIAMPVSADVFLSTDTSGGTNADTGVAGAGKLLRIYIASNSEDELGGITADFEIEAGVVTDGQVSATGAGTSGFLGSGNLQASDFLIKGSTTGFLIDQEFTEPQLLLGLDNREKWFEVEIDTSGLASGTYFLALQSPNNTFFDSTGTTAFATNNDLTFSVIGIPEPCAVVLLGLMAGGMAVRRRRVGNTSLCDKSLAA